jgi:hypothetical protein
LNLNANDDGSHGQHRGFTNETHFLKLDDGKEMIFVVDLPADRGTKMAEGFRNAVVENDSHLCPWRSGRATDRDVAQKGRRGRET